MRVIGRGAEIVDFHVRELALRLQEFAEPRFLWTTQYEAAFDDAGNDEELPPPRSSLD